MKKISVLSFALLFLISCLLLPPKAAPTPTAPPVTATLNANSAFHGGLTKSYQNVVETMPLATKYDLRLEIADDLYHVSGTEFVQYFNAEDVALNEVELRLFPNILGGEMTVDNITVNGELVNTSLSLEGSLLTILFKDPLAPKQSVDLHIDFQVTVPQDIELNYGVLAFYDNVLALAHAYPMIAVYDDEGWNAEIPPQSGDVTYADMSFFIVRVTAPSEVTLAAVGREIQRQDNGSRQTVTYEAGPVRDFYLAASPDYQVVTKEENGVTFRFYTKENLLSGAEDALNIASNAVKVYNERYAPYPYTELDFVSTPTFALGIEYPGMIAITDWIIEPGHPYLEATVAHEAGHQWFYNLVGNDQLDDPWLDESLTQFATMQYFADEYGIDGYNGFRDELESRWSFIENQDIPIDLPVRFYTDAEYGAIVYGRGPLFFDALREKMGETVFDAFMKDYTKENSWQVSTPEILRSTAEQHCKCDLTSLFDEWVSP